MNPHFKKNKIFFLRINQIHRKKFFFIRGIFFLGINFSKFFLFFKKEKMEAKASDLLSSIDVVLSRIHNEEKEEINQITVEAKELIATIVHDALQNIVFHIHQKMEKDKKNFVDIDTIYQGFLAFLQETKKEVKQPPYISIDLESDVEERCKKEREKKVENRIDFLIGYLETRLRLRFHIYQNHFAPIEVTKILDQSEFMQQNHEFIKYKKQLLSPITRTTPSPIQHPMQETRMTKKMTNKNLSSKLAISPTRLTTPMSQMKLEQLDHRQL